MKTIHIPRVNPNTNFTVTILRSGIVETEKALKVRLAKQEIAGVTIPNGFEIWIPESSVLAIDAAHSNSPTVWVPGWKLNKVLKYIYIEGLRNAKN